MNAHNMNVDSALALAPSDMIADTLRNSVLRDVANMTETGDAALDTLRSKAADMATLAGHWHDPRESFTALHGAATRSGLIPAAQSRGILIAAFGADYSQLDIGRIGDDLPETAPIGAISQDVGESFSTKVRRALALSPDSAAKLAELERLAIEANERIDDGGLDYSFALDEMIEAADAHGLCAKYGRDTIEHVCAIGLKGRASRANGKVAMSVTTRVGAAVPSEHGPIPLVAELAPAEAYPVNALGPVLSRGAVAIARKIQAPIEMAAQSVLAVAALAAQAHADVQLPFGQTRPLSLALITVASSGDRKTSTDREAAWPVRTYEEELGADYADKQEAHRIALAAWDAEKKRIEGDKKPNRDGRKLMLEDLGPVPLAPLHPFMTAPEPTIEGTDKGNAARAWLARTCSAQRAGSLLGGTACQPTTGLKPRRGFRRYGTATRSSAYVRAMVSQSSKGVGCRCT